MTDLVQWNNCVGCMRKRPLLSKQSSYEAQLGSLTRNSRLIVNAPHGYTSPMVHSHYGTEPVTVGSAQHLQCTAEPVDQQSALRTYFWAFK